MTSEEISRAGLETPFRRIALLTGNANLLISRLFLLRLAPILSGY